MFRYSLDVATTSGDRSQHFPAIEKKYGEKIDFWIKKLHALGDAKYQQQIDLLRQDYGFSQAHANALVMYVRGSTTSKRFASPSEFFSSVDPVSAKTAQAIFAAITKKYPKLELVVAWNQPMLRSGKGYVFGLSIAKNHITINPFSTDALEVHAGKLASYSLNKKTFTVPRDWKVDAALLKGLVKVRLSELK